jgi:hypothetical protein
MRSTLAVALGIAVLISIGGCKQQTKTEAPAPASEAHPGAQAGMSLSGKVVETMSSGGYTYVCLADGGKKTWVAVPQTAVKVGQMVTCQPGMEMRNFTSKTLNRTFESIIFSSGIM